jgi:hypothetical protein
VKDEVPKTRFNSWAIAVDLRYLQGILALALRSIGMERSNRQSLVVEEVIDLVALDFCVDEDQCTLRFASHDQVEEGLILGRLLNIDDVLLDILVSAADTPNLDSNEVLVHVVAGKATRFLGEGGGEHQVGVISVRVRVCKIY